MEIVVLEVIVVFVLLAGVYFLGQLAWLVGGSCRMVWRGWRKHNAAVRRNLAAKSAEELRSQLLADVYFSDAIRANATVGAFLDRIARGQEVELRREYPKRKLYGMLMKAERAAGRQGMPWVYDTTVFEQFDELARRTDSRKSAV